MKFKRRLLLGKKVMINLDNILKSRDITLPTNFHLVKAMVFPVVMYGCESWTVKKAERRRIDAFELWCWRRLLRFPWTARRSNQSILKEIILGVLWKDWCWGLNSNTLATTEDEMAGWHHRLDGREFEWTLGVGDGQGGLACCNSWGRKESDTTERLDWTELRVNWRGLGAFLWRLEEVFIPFSFAWDKDKRQS